MRKSRIIRSKKTYKKYKTEKVFSGGAWGQSIAKTQSTNKFFSMSFPESKKTAQHENIFSEMLAVDSKIARNSIISDLEIISTIIIDGDFAKNDCDDIWALAYLSKNIGKVNGDKPLPRLICGSLNGAVNMQSVISSDTNIDKETSGFVKTRRIRGLTGNVIIYILGGVDDDEVVSYEDND
jgi:hypothetical protein